jgi:hypothetical protein
VSDIVIVYARADHASAAALAAVLETRGWTVWWDRHVHPGGAFDEVVDQAIARARCAVVLWSAASIASPRVRREASAALARGIVVSALIEDVQVPPDFRLLPPARLVGWFGDEEDHELSKLLDAVGRRVAVDPRRAAAPVARRAPRALYRSPGFIAAVLLLLGFAAGALVMRYLEEDDDSGYATQAVPHAAASVAAPAPGSAVAGEG